MQTDRTGADDRNLDLLRAVAVLLVLIPHIINYTIAPVSAEPLLSVLGNDGVIIFFVHTSLVLMRSLERTGSRGLRGWAHARDFYVRRAFRLYPLAICTVLAVIAFRIQREPTDLSFIPPTAREVAANLTLTQNLWGARTLLAPLWSLPYEIEMYLLLPLLFVLVRRARVRWQLIALTALSVAVAIVYLFVFTRTRGLWRLSVLKYLPCFAAGVLAYRSCQLTRPKIPAPAWPIILLSIVGLSSFLRPETMNEYGRGWLVSLTVASFIPLVRELPVSALTRGTHLIAKYSYGIYLSHVPVLDVAVRMMQHQPLWMRATVGIAGILLLPVILFHSLEQPMMQLGARFAARLAHRKQAVETLASTAPAP